MSDFHPFKDEEEVEKITKEREYLIETLQKYNMPESERMFILRKISNITEKLLEKARYGKE